MPKDTVTMPSNDLSIHAQTGAQGAQPGKMRLEGITVTGEAIRRVAPENAEFVIELAASAPTAAQALRDNQQKTAQLAHALATLGVQQTDLETLSLNVFSLYAPMPALAGFGPMPQIGAAPVTGEVQFGSYQAHATLRINVREAGRVGEIVDAAVRAGGILAGGFSFRVSDESHARRAVLEAAGRDARSKAETLAAAAGKQVGDPVAISEDLLVSNGAYAALRMAVPFAFGVGAQRPTGELEYYARVSANFRLQ